MSFLRQKEIEKRQNKSITHYAKPTFKDLEMMKAFCKNVKDVKDLENLETPSLFLTKVSVLDINLSEEFFNDLDHHQNEEIKSQFDIFMQDIYQEKDGDCMSLLIILIKQIYTYFEIDGDGSDNEASIGLVCFKIFNEKLLKLDFSFLEKDNHTTQNKKGVNHPGVQNKQNGAINQQKNDQYMKKEEANTLADFQKTKYSSFLKLLRFCFYPSEEEKDDCKNYAKTHNKLNPSHAKRLTDYSRLIFPIKNQFGNDYAKEKQRGEECKKMSMLYIKHSYMYNEDKSIPA